jgi:hypothetical protein
MADEFTNRVVQIGAKWPTTQLKILNGTLRFLLWATFLVNVIIWILRGMRPSAPPGADAGDGAGPFYESPRVVKWCHGIFSFFLRPSGRNRGLAERSSIYSLSRETERG